MPERSGEDAGAVQGWTAPVASGAVRGRSGGIAVMALSRAWPAPTRGDAGTTIRVAESPYNPSLMPRNITGTPWISPSAKNND